jgi:hypothetical protein
LVSQSPISKHDETFFMYLFANDKDNALSLAKKNWGNGCQWGVATYER